MRKDIWKNAFNQAMSELSEEDLTVEEKTRKEKHTPAGKPGIRFIQKLASYLAIAAVLAIFIRFVLVDPLHLFGPSQSFLPGKIVNETLSGGVPHNVDLPHDGFQESDMTLSNDVDPTAEQNAEPSYNAAQLTLVRAVYPDQLRYTKENVRDQDSDFYTRKYQERLQRRKTAAAYKGKLDAFYQSSLEAFLTDSKDDNALISPAGLFLSLSLLAESAEGESREEILQVLGAETIEELRGLSATFWQNEYNDDGLYTCCFANSVWLNTVWLDSPGYPAFIPGLYTVRDDALQRIKDSYFTSVFQGDMRSEEYNTCFRDWLSEETGLLFPNGVNSPVLDPFSLLEIASTVNFNARWVFPFNPEQTTEGIFRGKKEDTTVSYMRMSIDDIYYYGEQFSAVNLSLSGANTLWLFLPDEGIDVRSLAADEAVFSLMKTAEDGNAYGAAEAALAIVHLSLPKFTVSLENNLIPAFEQMGIQKVFTKGEADLSGLLITEEPAYVSKATNSLRLTVDEEGVKASSLITLDYYGARKPDKEVDFTLDRPFLYAVTSHTGGLLFVGVVDQIG